MCITLAKLQRILFCSRTLADKNKFQLSNVILARSDQFAEAVERGRYILPAAVRHCYRCYHGTGRVLLQDQRRGQTSQGAFETADRAS